jgi:hypothetical protein
MSLEHERTQLTQTLDLFVEDSWRNVYAGQLEVRPPAAPTSAPDRAVLGPVIPQRLIGGMRRWD